MGNNKNVITNEAATWLARLDDGLRLNVFDQLFDSLLPSL